LITRLGEVIGTDGALIERHRQSGSRHLRRRHEVFGGEPDGLARYHELILQPQNLWHGARSAAVESGYHSFMQLRRS
jgi:hypothetical protein